MLLFVARVKRSVAASDGRGGAEESAPMSTWRVLEYARTIRPVEIGQLERARMHHVMLPSQRIRCVAHGAR